MSDAAKIIAENTARMVKGTAIKSRFCDMLNASTTTDNRTGDQIVNDVLAKAGLEVTS